MTGNIYSLIHPVKPQFAAGKGRVTLENNDNTGGLVESRDHWALLVKQISDDADRDAFKCLYNYFAPRVKSFMLRSGLKEDAAEEIAQETLLTVWRKSAQFNRDLASVSTWIFTIARNKKIDKFRRDSKPLPDVEDPTYPIAEEKSPEHNVEHALNAEKLHRALKTLPDDQREVLVLSFLQNSPHKDIAHTLNIPLGTVKSRIRLGLSRLRSLVDDGNGDLK